MAKAKLELGVELDLLSAPEFRQGLDHLHNGLMREMARGLKPIRLAPIQLTTAASQIPGGVISVGGDTPNAQQFGPKEGYIWAVRRISFFGTVAADSISIWRGDPANRGNFVQNLTGVVGIATFPKGALTLHPGETLAFSGTGLTSTEISISCEAIEAPAEMVYKLVS